MTRSHTLDNWDGHLSKFESNKRPQAVRGQPVLSPPLETSGLPVSTTSDLQRPAHYSFNSKASVEESLNCGRSKYLADDASNERPHNNIPHSLEKRLFELSDISDTDLISDIVTDALHPSSSVTRDNEPRSPSIFRNGTRRSSVSAFPPNPEMFVPSPALTVQTISTYTADAHGEEEDDDVVIVNHIQTSFQPKNKPFDKPPIDTHYDSLFTPPPSEAGTPLTSSESPPPFNDRKKRTRKAASPPPRKVRIVASHVLVPPLLKPKSEYIKLSSLIKIRPHRTAQDRLKDVMNAVWDTNESLDWSGDGDGDGRRKRRKRKHKPQERTTRPIPTSPQLYPDNEGSVVFVNRSPKFKRLVEERPHPAEATVIDLTLDDEDDKPINPISPPSQTTKFEETYPGLQPSSRESRICIGVVHSIPYKTLVHNTRFLRCSKGDTDLHKDFVVLGSLLPFRGRRALLENNLEGSSFLNDEFSLGFPVVTGSGQGMIDEGSDDDDSGYDVIELLDSSPAPEHVPKPGTPPPPPKIDLAAKFRKKKTATVLRPSSILTPVKRTAPLPPTSARSPASLLKNEHVRHMPIDEDGYDPRTPLVPSAKALGKRKAIESSPLQPRPDDQLSFPPLPSEEDIPFAADNSFDSYINYWPLSPVRPMTLISVNPSLHLGAGDPYAYPDPYSNISVSNFNFVDHRQHHSPSYSSVDPPPASLMYHSNGYSETPDDFGRFPGSVPHNPPPPSETLLHAWPAEMDTSFQYDDGTINPSLLGGEPLGIPENPEPYFPEVGSEFLDAEKEPKSSSISMTHSPSHSPTGSHMTLSTSPKSESLHPVETLGHADSETIYVRRPNSFVSGHSPSLSKRRHVQRLMPDMVPLSVLSLSSSSSSEYEEETDDESSRRRSIKPRSGVRSTLSNGDRQQQQQTKTKTRPTVARKAAAVLPAGLNTSGPKVMLGGQLWPMQDEAVYCHQCRNKTMVLKLECPECKKLFCVRCLTLRYPDEPRALRMKEVNCPACHDYCNCTKCCERRGVQYISTKDAQASGVAKAQLKARKKPKSKIPPPADSSSLSLSPVPDVATSSPSPLYSLPHTPTGGEYWGVVYGADGSKIGTGYSFAKENLRERRSPAVPTNGVYWGVVYGADGSRIGKGYTFSKEDAGMIIPTKPVAEEGTTTQPKTKRRRVYVGDVHPSWRFDNAVKKTVLDPVPPPKRVHESRRPRKYVGNKAFLFYKSEKMARELADLSPLSSIEEDWDEEDQRIGVWSEEDSFEKAGNDYREDSREGSLKSLSDQDVMRAIGLGLHACGIQLAE